MDFQFENPAENQSINQRWFSGFSWFMLVFQPDMFHSSSLINKLDQARRPEDQQANLRCFLAG